YEIDTVPDFSSPVLVSGSSGTSLSQATVSDLYFGTTYYWRARAYNAVDTSAWSNVTNFTTASALSNHSPANGAMNVSVNPTIDWTYLSGLDGYICQVDTSAAFNSGHFQELTSSSGSSQTDVSGLLYGTTYHWRVAAYHAQDTSEWTDVWEFTTDYQLTDAPVLVSPADGSTDIPFDLVMAEWAAVAGAESYQYQYSTDETFETSVHSEITSLLTTNFTELQPQTSYFWRVRGANNTGYSPWSDVWSFTTESAPLEPPVLVSPADNATGLDPSEIFLVWYDVFGASEFDYQISTDATFATGVTGGTENDTLVSLSGLSEETQFFWRVKSGNSTQESAWSETWSFTTGLYNSNFISAAEDIQLYPNPARGIVNFKDNLPEDAFVEIQNNSGQIVLTQKMHTNRLDVSSLSAGTYVVRIHSADEYMCGKLVIH
ncbi:MAG: T9SS type A sorting domain-containing protein, partial [Bacteroidota bacterium]